ncbi:MAG: acetylxylan esterase [Undibacterium sp.]|nr:acetylxylan esterase [Opitutaceae bacterium]
MPRRPARFALLALAAVSLAHADVSRLPPGLPPAPATGPALCPAGFLTPAQGAAVLDVAITQFPDRASWDTYVTHLRTRIQEAAGLAPWPKRTPLNAIIRDRRTHDGYTVENVAFESAPGIFVTGNLYRPLGGAGGEHPVILSTHGHANKVVTPADYDTHARFAPTMQTRCANLARMGAIVFSIDMFAYGEGIQLYGQEAHRDARAITIHVWNGMRALDFLLSLDGADPTRVAVSGESGGGTQTFLIAALDPRVAVSAPVVMVSAHFFGGCPCESGVPIHRGADYFANNAMIAALTAPRPQLLVSDGKDWTANTPRVEFPFLQKIYGYYGAADKVANVHLPDEGHDYGPSKRAAVYRFFATQLGLNLAAVTDAAGKIDESRVTLDRAAALRVFTADFPVPPHAVHDAAAIGRAFTALQKP